MPDNRTLISVCFDCLNAAANGEFSENVDKPPLGLIGRDEQISLGMFYSEHHETCPNRKANEFVDECNCEDLGFCDNSPCQGCGTTDAGDRFSLTLWY